LLAQDEKKPAQAGAEMQMPDPKHKEHEALAAMAGTWDCVMKMEAMPGVPGMEKAAEVKGTEKAELICNGLWLKSTVDSTWQGQPFHGVWLAGYDPFEKQYTGIWISSDESETGACTMEGNYDAKTKTWNWNGKSSHGDTRSVVVMSSPDKSVETCYVTGPDGKEMKCMEITRTRSKAPAAMAKTSKPTGLSKEQEMLLGDVGEWDAVVKSTGGPEGMGEEKGTERVTAVCNGRWLWSDFTGNMMGAPFEGHGIMGYDPKQAKVVSIWIDSMSPNYAMTTGTCDLAKKTCTLSGDATCPTGDPMSIQQVITKKDENTRAIQMEFKTKDGTQNMEITYKRKSQG
jgi:hypothetical protein